LRLATRKRVPGFKGKTKRVFLEEKILLTGKVSNPDLYDNFLDEIKQEIESLHGLAFLLHEVGSALEFRALRCIGITMREDATNRVKLIYELPDWADPNQEPMTLARLIAYTKMQDPGRVTEQPSLTTRFQLATVLVSAIYQLHSSSWMHREMSAENVIFFQGFRNLLGEKQSPQSLTTLYDLKNPYLDGFKNSRSSVYGLSPSYDDDPKRLAMFWVQEQPYRHSSYLLHKRWGNGSRRKFHRFRHEYYSLGLILLEIGLWLPLAGLHITTMTDDNEKNNISETKTFSLISDERLTDTITTLFSRIAAINVGDTWEKLDSEGWPKGMNEIVKSLKGAIRDEQIEDITATPVKMNGDNHLKGLCEEWGQLYPLELLRQSAIKRAERDLGITMGEKY
jgi:hypothetical protein